MPSDNNLSRSQILSEPGRWNDYTREREVNFETVQAVNFTLNQASAGAGTDIAILADVLTLDGAVNLPGKSVTLVARRIVCINQAAINTTGISAIPNVARAESGRTPGANGSDGSQGANGGAGGNILLAACELVGALNLIADGGTGAAGQTGGNGAIGANGSVGSAATRWDRPGNGGPGGKGGKGGVNGIGGNGGDAGEIIVLLASDGGKISDHALGGAFGAAGLPGQGGPGGKGGAAGNPRFTNPPRGIPGSPGYDPGGESWYEPGANAGPDGPVGDHGDVNPSVPIQGKDIASKISTVSIQEIAPEVPITQIRMSLFGAFTKFTNEQTDDLASQLSWLRDIALAEKSGASFYDKRAARAGAVEVGRPTRAELDAIGNQCAQFLQRLRSGLDVFGYASNYVSFLSPDYLQQASEKLFEIATAIEQSHDKYLDSLSNMQDAGDSLNAALSTVESMLALKRADVERAAGDADIAQDEIEALALTISELTQRLQQADYEFRDAVSAKNGGCELMQLVEFVVGVVAICYGVYSGYVAIADSFKTANSGAGGKGFVNDLIFLADTFKSSDIDKAFKSMQEGYQKVQDALKSDDTKLVVSLEAFEEQLKPYLGMKEADNYRILMRQLVDVARAKNDKQIAYTQFILKSVSARAEEVSLGQEADRINRLVAETGNPALSDCVVYLTSYLESAKYSLIELLDLHRRSLVYTSLVPIKPSYRAAIIADLRATQMTMTKYIADALQKRGGEEQTFESEYVISREKHPWFFDALQEKNEAVFAIPYDESEFNRGGTSFVTVFQVDISIPGIKSPTDKFTCRLTHQGNSIILDQSGNLMNFSHPKRPSILSYRFKGDGWIPTFDIENNLRGSRETYIYLSPFASWTLRFDDDVDFSDVREIRFIFQGNAIPANQRRSEQLFRDFVLN